LLIPCRRGAVVRSNVPGPGYDHHPPAGTHAGFGQVDPAAGLDRGNLDDYLLERDGAKDVNRDPWASSAAGDPPCWALRSQGLSVARVGWYRPSPPGLGNTPRPRHPRVSDQTYIHSSEREPELSRSTLGGSSNLAANVVRIPLIPGPGPRSTYKASTCRRAREARRLMMLPQTAVLHHTRDWFFELS
jgi:hypothetical protein